MSLGLVVQLKTVAYVFNRLIDYYQYSRNIVKIFIALRIK